MLALCGVGLGSRVLYDSSRRAADGKGRVARQVTAPAMVQHRNLRCVSCGLMHAVLKRVCVVPSGAHAATWVFADGTTWPYIKRDVQVYANVRLRRVRWRDCLHDLTGCEALRGFQRLPRRRICGSDTPACTLSCDCSLANETMDLDEPSPES